MSGSPTAEEPINVLESVSPTEMKAWDMDQWIDFYDRMMDTNRGVEEGDQFTDESCNPIRFLKACATLAREWDEEPRAKSVERYGVDLARNSLLYKPPSPAGWHREWMKIFSELGVFFPREEIGFADELQLLINELKP